MIWENGIETMYNIIYETNSQSRFNAWYWMLGAGALRRPRGMVRGGRRRGVFRMRNMCIPAVDSCWCMAKPIQYCKVISLQLKKKKRTKKKRRQGWNDLGEWHWNNVYYHMWNRLPVQVQCIRQGAQGWCTGMMGWGGRWEGGSGWGTRVHPWWIHVDVWQNQYNIVK